MPDCNMGNHESDLRHVAGLCQSEEDGGAEAEGPLCWLRTRSGRDEDRRGLLSF